MPLRTILFDINETVLDLAGLRPAFVNLFQGAVPLELWFSNLLQSSVVALTTGLETNFKDLARANLLKLLEKHQLSAKEGEIEHFLQGFATLPPHGDVKPALEMLKRNNFKTIAFSNSAITLLESQIRSAGLNAHFDQLISVEEVKSFKPDPKVYRHAAATLGQDPGDLMLVAVHDWDTHGALSAGLNAAFLERGPGLYNPLYRKPAITGKTMIELAQKIIKEYGSPA